MKKFSVCAFYEELKPAHAAHQVCIVEAITPDIAAGRGLKEIRSRDAVKRRRIHKTVLTITEISNSKTIEEPADERGDR